MADEQSYHDSHARFYHERAERQVDDVAYYREQAVAADGPVLELACGTGRIYLEVLRAGVDADGIDVSEDALAVLREVAAGEGLEPSVRQGDMVDLTPDREYDLVYCPFNAVQHVHSVEDQLDMLDGVYDALAPGGQFVFDVFVPSFDVIAETYDEWQCEDVEFRGDPHEYRTRSTLDDEVEQYFLVEEELRTDDGEVVFETDHRLKLLPKREIELLARCSSFDDWAVTGDFTDEALSDGHSVQVWTLERT